MADPFTILGALGGLAGMAGTAYGIYSAEQAQEDAKKAAKKFAEEAKKNNTAGLQKAIDDYTGGMGTKIGQLLGVIEMQDAEQKASAAKQTTGLTVGVIVGAVVLIGLVYFLTRRKR